jgi:predicted type IV restriction endonuclease
MKRFSSGNGLDAARFPATCQRHLSEAAISHGVVTPILNGLGWDAADPSQLAPEFRVPSGRVDFAVLGSGRRPCIFIEVKGVGRAMDGDLQLFQYAFHKGVPLCVLTDGREWSFYLPAGQGSYEDRRIYRLQLDDRDPAECERVLNRDLARDRVRDGSAFEDAQRDYKDAAGRREAVATLPRAWAGRHRRQYEPRPPDNPSRADAGGCPLMPGA